MSSPNFGSSHIQKCSDKADEKDKKGGNGKNTVRELLELSDLEASRLVFGVNGRHLDLVERLFSVRAHARGNRITLVGSEEPVRLAKDLLEQLYDMAKDNFSLAPGDVKRAAQTLMDKQSADLKEIFVDTVLVCNRGRKITPKGLAQKHYVDVMRKRDIVFSIGPAGTGKTYLAMAMAVRALKDRHVKRIILVRPAVEAGEKLGFLPGDMLEKVNPYLRPLYDALNDMMDFSQVHQLIEDGRIEVAPLAFMRGRTLNDSFVVMDEAQNTTTDQMKMFLTRLGYDSKAVVTGDVTQTDLPEGCVSGLVEAYRILKDIDDIGFCHFDERDVVRHPLVQKIIRAYESYQHKPLSRGVEGEQTKEENRVARGGSGENPEKGEDIAEDPGEDIGD